MIIEIGLRQSFEMDWRMDNFHVEGMYDMDGVYVSIFPIFGTGEYVWVGFQLLATIGYYLTPISKAFGELAYLCTPWIKQLLP